MEIFRLSSRPESLMCTCLICECSVVSDFKSKYEQVPEHCSNLFEVFSKYMQWSGRSTEKEFCFENELFPFCRTCTLVLNHLYQLDQQLEDIHKSIKRIIDDASGKIFTRRYKHQSLVRDVSGTGGIEDENSDVINLQFEGRDGAVEYQYHLDKVKFYRELTINQSIVEKSEVPNPVDESSDEIEPEHEPVMTEILTIPTVEVEEANCTTNPHWTLEPEKAVCASKNVLKKKRYDNSVNIAQTTFSDESESKPGGNNGKVTLASKKFLYTGLGYKRLSSGNLECNNCSYQTDLKNVMELHIKKKHFTSSGPAKSFFVRAIPGSTNSGTAVSTPNVVDDLRAKTLITQMFRRKEFKDRVTKVKDREFIFDGKYKFKLGKQLKWICLTCDKTFGQLLSLEIHMLYHLSDSGYSNSEKSDERVIANSEDIDYAKGFHLAQDGKYKCCFCIAAIPDKTVIMRHVQQHHWNQLKPSKDTEPEVNPALGATPKTNAVTTTRGSKPVYRYIKPRAWSRAKVTIGHLYRGRLKDRIAKIGERRFILDHKFPFMLNSRDKWCCCTCEHEFSKRYIMENHLLNGCRKEILAPTAKNSTAQNERSLEDTQQEEEPELEVISVVEKRSDTAMDDQNHVNLNASVEDVGPTLKVGTSIVANSIVNHGDTSGEQNVLALSKMDKNEYEAMRKVQNLLLHDTLKGRIRRIGPRTLIFDDQYPFELSLSNKWVCLTCNRAFSGRYALVDRHLILGCRGGKQPDLKINPPAKFSDIAENNLVSMEGENSIDNQLKPNIEADGPFKIVSVSGNVLSSPLDSGCGNKEQDGRKTSGNVCTTQPVTKSVIKDASASFQHTSAMTKIENLLHSRSVKDRIRRLGPRTLIFDEKYPFELSTNDKWTCLSCNRPFSGRYALVDRHLLVGCKGAQNPVVRLNDTEFVYKGFAFQRIKIGHNRWTNICRSCEYSNESKAIILKHIYSTHVMGDVDNSDTSRDFEQGASHSVLPDNGSQGEGQTTPDYAFGSVFATRVSVQVPSDDVSFDVEEAHPFGDDTFAMEVDGLMPDIEDSSGVKEESEEINILP